MRLGALAAALLATPAGGCTPPCTGVGCEQAYPASFLAVYRADELLDAEPSLADWWLAAAGDAGQGTGWDIAFAGPDVFVGSPGDGAVRRVRLARDRAMALDEAVAAIRTGDGAFGGAVDALVTEGGIDLLVGAPGEDATPSSRNEGAAYVFRDLPADLSGSLAADDIATLHLAGPADEAGLGERVAWCGDIDGDGRADWAVAAPLASPGGRALAGAAWVGLSAGEAGMAGTLGLDAAITGSAVGARLGTALSCRDDLDGDGVADLLLGSPFADADADARGAVYVVSGASLPAAGPAPDLALGALWGREAETWAGRAVATGDLDGDGLPDVAVGSPGAWDSRGEVLVWRGAGLLEALAGEGEADYRITGDADGGRFGQAVAIADLDGDGLGDLVVGAPSLDADATAVDAGALYAFSGAAGFAGWSTRMTPADARFTLAAAEPYLNAGERVATGDFDGDGRADLALGMRQDPDAPPAVLTAPTGSTARSSTPR